ncbi:MAG: hypothetical protein LBD33_01990 [Puniceicoccales bacterium]|jgi:hypothetical protein|nr:hypothetical protein [Puniceicoccales bacterium]
MHNSSSPNLPILTGPNSPPDYVSHFEKEKLSEVRGNDEGDEQPQVKQVEGMDCAQTMGKTMRVSTPNRDIRSRRAKVGSAPAQVPLLRGNGRNEEIGRLRDVVERVKRSASAAFNPQALVEMEGWMSALEQGQQPLENNQLEALQIGINNLQSLADFLGKGELELEPRFVADTVQAQLGIAIAGEAHVHRGGLKNCVEIFAILEREPVAAALEQFRDEFLPGLGGSAPAQVEAEKRNLRHIMLSADEMLTSIGHGGLGFNSEFVARMVYVRLNLTMFRAEFSPNSQNVCKFWKIDCVVDSQNPDKILKLIVKREDLRQICRLLGVRVCNKIGREQQIDLCEALGLNCDELINELRSKIPPQYQPLSMFDFGPERASVELGPFQSLEKSSNKLVGHTYPITGRASSPDVYAAPDAQPLVPTHRGAPFSFLRDSGNGISYAMPDGQQTLCLGERFRQFLRTMTPDGRWSSLEFNTPLMELPPAMMFLVGLQFGQINAGTWNPFTLAAKRYFALQSCNLPAEIGDRFFWQDGTAPHFIDSKGPEYYNSLLLEAFGPLFAALELDFNPAVATQFEIALHSYYAVNMEVLSRVSFDGNDPEKCQMTQIFRFEGIEALEPMGMVITADGGATYAAADESSRPFDVPVSSKRSVLVSSSARMFSFSLDKSFLFPPPIKVITQYDEVPHARIFGTHLFGVDYSNASRALPTCVSNSLHHTEYAKEGCQFFHDNQREFLLMPVGLRANIPGVLVSSPGSTSPCVALTKKSYDPVLFDGFKKVAQFEEKAADKAWELKTMLKQFCLRDFPDDPIAPLIDYFSQNKIALMQQLHLREYHLRRSINTCDMNALDDYRLRELKKSPDSDAANLQLRLEEAKKNWADAKAQNHHTDDKNNAREEYVALYSTIKQHSQRLQCVPPEVVLATQRRQLLAIIDRITGGGEVQFLEFIR